MLLVNISSSEATVGGGGVLTPSSSYPEWIPAALHTLRTLVLSCLPEAQPMLMISNASRKKFNLHSGSVCSAGEVWLRTRGGIR